MSNSTSNDHLTARGGPRHRVASLFELLGTNNSLAIVCHNDPDPDCLASAFALERLAHRQGVQETHVVYDGGISHRQNQAMIDRLDLDLCPYDPARVADAELTAFVDQSVPGENNPLSRGADLDLVIDHHPCIDVGATYVDSRPSYGATATILTEYYRTTGIAPDERVATALLFGIRRETLEFLRGSTTLGEYEAAQFLHPYADIDLVQTLSESLFSTGTLDAIGDVIANRTRQGATLVSNPGTVPDREAIPLAADYMLNLAGTSTTAVFGVVDDAVEVSARTQDADLHVGRRLARAFDGLGSAGGHRGMAGASVPLDALAGSGRVDRVATEVEGLIFDHLGDPR